MRFSSLFLLINYPLFVKRIFALPQMILRSADRGRRDKPWWARGENRELPNGRMRSGSVPASMPGTAKFPLFLLDLHIGIL
jgi:hypothetical protein